MVVWRLRTISDERDGSTRHERTDNSKPRFRLWASRDPFREPVLKEPALNRVSRLTQTSPARDEQAEPTLLSRILSSLDDDKAEEIVTIDLAGRSSLCDALVVASGRSQRHVASTAEHLARRLKEAGYGSARVEGLPQGDWVLVDAGDVIVHLFRPEVRTYYDLEGMWSVDDSSRQRSAAL
jgi:ribosome-associated protein